MPNYAGLAAKKAQLIRKALGGSLFITETLTSSSLIPALTDATTGLLLPLPTSGGYVDCGLFTDEGLRYTRAVEQDEVTSFGRNTATRTDITSDTDTLAVDLQETSKLTIALATGAATSGLTLTTGSKELRIDKPAIAAPRRYRGLALAVDGPPEAEIYLARWYPKLVVTDFGDQADAKGAEKRYPLTFRAEVDDTVGTALRYFWGGPGWQALLADMGFPTT